MRYFLVVVALVLSLAQCAEFEDNFVAVSEEPLASLDGFLLKDGAGHILADTFQIYGPKSEISFGLNANQIDTISVRVSVNGRVLTTVSDTNGTFILDADLYPDGVHEIKFEITTNTGTGSLADMLSAELIRWTILRHFSIESVPAKANKITSTSAYGGRLKIEWEDDPLSQKKLRFNYTSLNKSWEVAVSDPSQTSYIDDRYVGGDMSIALVTMGTRSTDPVATTSLKINLDKPVIAESTTDGYGKITLKWNRSQFFNNVSAYSLLHDGNLLFTSTALDTVAITDQIPFWGPESVELRTYSKGLADGNDTPNLRTSQSVTVGVTLLDFLNGMVHAPLAPEKGFRINASTDQVYVLNGDMVEAKFSIPLSTSFAPCVIASDGSAIYYADAGKVRRVDRSGVITVILDTNSIYGQTLSMSALTLGADRYLSFNSSGKTYMFDIVNQLKVFDRPAVTSTLYQTTDGNFLIEKLSNLKMNVHTLSGGQIQSTAVIDMPASSVFIDVLDGNKIVGIEPRSIHTYDPYSGQQSQKSIGNSDLIYGSRYVYDNMTGLAGTEYLDYFIVVDTRKGEILRKIFVSRNTNEFMLYSGAIYVYSRKLDLKL